MLRLIRGGAAAAPAQGEPCRSGNVWYMHGRSPHEPDVTSGRGGTDQPRGPNTTTDRPRPWSAEDLRQRLERLPGGHPSSPYHADGSRKPPPPDLRTLELPAPAEAPAAAAAPAAGRAGDRRER